MATLSRIVLVRHGETEGNSRERFHGKTDVALSLEGRAQARDAAHALGRQEFDRIVSSPLSRAWVTARIVASAGAIQLETDFREIDFGRWEGLTRDEIRERDPGLYVAWTGGHTGFEFPGGERREHFRSRVDRAMDRILTNGDGSVLIVAHKGVLKRIVDRLAGVVFEGEKPVLGGVLQLSRGGSGWQLAHMRPPESKLRR